MKYYFFQILLNKDVVFNKKSVFSKVDIMNKTIENNVGDIYIRNFRQRFLKVYFLTPQKSDFTP